MSLKEYKKKRDFSKTSEPKGSLQSKNKKKIFVIHFHKAKNNHYDLRLEMDKVLKSWAIPKNPLKLKSKGTKRLAIQVPDHELGYANFEGEIKEGYGKGKVEIWDTGRYNLLKKDSKKIEIEIFGKKLKGKYVLVKTNYGKNKEQKKKSWLFFKIN